MADVSDPRPNTARCFVVLASHLPAWCRPAGQPLSLRVVQAEEGQGAGKAPGALRQPIGLNHAETVVPTIAIEVATFDDRKLPSATQRTACARHRAEMLSDTVEQSHKTRIHMVLHVAVEEA